MEELLMGNIDAIKQAAKGRWQEIHHTFASAVDPITSRSAKHGPCAYGGTDRARCHNDYEETGGIICSQCGMGADGIAVLMKVNGWDFKATMSHLEQYLGISQSTGPATAQSKSEKFHSVYEKASSDDPIVAAYLKSRNPALEVIEPLRGTKADYWDSSGSKPVSLGEHPAMIAPFIRDGEIVGRHETLLKHDGGGKADVPDPKKTKKAPGVDKLTGAYIPLGNSNPTGKLGVGEGLETALGASKATGMTVWACGNAHLLEKIKIPADVIKNISELHIYADKDRTDTGLVAAKKLAQRYACQKRRVFIHLPEGGIPEGEKSIDWLDVLNAKGPDFICDAVEKTKPFHKKKNKESIEIPEADSGTPHLTDYGNSLRFVKLHGHKVKYVHAWGKFIIWNGKNWEKDISGKVYKLATETALSIYAEAASQPDYPEQKKIIDHARNSQSKNRLDAMLGLVKHQITISPTQLDDAPYLFNCTNGTIDLKTGELLPHDPNHFLSKISPVEFNLNTECPIWQQFLSEIFNDDLEMVEFIQRAIGYSLTGDTSEQCLFFLHGTGRNGKSTLLETLMVLLDDFSTKAEMKAFMEKKSDSVSNDLACLAGARLVCAVESGRSQHFNESLVKEILGQDLITARFLYQEFFSFKPQFKLFLAGNSKPIIRGADEGIWRRIRLLPFDVVIPKERVDRKLPEKLLKELPGGLSWAVRGCLDWQKNGLHEPKVVVDATDEYREEMDLLADFFSSEVITEAILELEKGKKKVEKGFLKVSAAQIYNRYTAWCEVSSVDPVRKRTFGLMMGERGFTSKPVFYQGKKQRVYNGLGILKTIHGEAIPDCHGTDGTELSVDSGNFPLHNLAYTKESDNYVPSVPCVPKENKKEEKEEKPDGVWELTI